VGQELMKSVMEAEVRQRVGEPHQPNRQREYYRWGQEQGYCVVDGQKVPLPRPRIRRKCGTEAPLGSYELFQRGSLIGEAVWTKVMHGLSMRSYGEVIQQFVKAYGVEKSTISEHFIRASGERLQRLLERRLDTYAIAVVIVDGTIFKQQNLVAAIGIAVDGRKIVLGFRQGATENATVVGELLSNLADRGLELSVPRLWVIDGSRFYAESRWYRVKGRDQIPLLCKELELVVLRTFSPPFRWCRIMSLSPLFQRSSDIL
jgi:transposase-like protein